MDNWITQVYPQQALCMSNPISHPPEGKPLFLTRAWYCSHPCTEMQHKVLPKSYQLLTLLPANLYYCAIIPYFALSSPWHWHLKRQSSCCHFVDNNALVDCLSTICEHWHVPLHWSNQHLWWTFNYFVSSVRKRSACKALQSHLLYFFFSYWLKALFHSTDLFSEWVYIKS